jgi:pantoate--beta-alanine ligase
MQVIDNISELRSARAALSGRIGLVPTMGALHDGHLSLVRAAQQANDAVIVTIFINPAQFAADEDLSKYPRDLPGDLDKLAAAGVDLVFTPTPDVMYPPGFQTWVNVTQVSQGLEGAARPDHFRGVATVVSKLFNLTQPQAAYFGQKDAQQVVVVKRMTHDLNFPLKIVVCPTAREIDGLALSSRNVYLSPEQRAAVPVLYQSLNMAAKLYEQGERSPVELRRRIQAMISEQPLAQLEYVSVADAATLHELDTSSDMPMLVSLTARFGTTRLLDNMLLPVHLNTQEGLTAVLGGL